MNYTEKDIMREAEKRVFSRLLLEIHPDTPLSIVSDTFDLWDVLTIYIPSLKEHLHNRVGGPLVVRPDSGDPVKIILGEAVNVANEIKEGYTPKDYGVLSLLTLALGLIPNPTGILPLIHGAAAIYGDAITKERSEEILKGIIYDLKISPKNQVFGVGSYTYQFVTRDTNGNAFKATAVVYNGVVYAIFKDPVTDSGLKKSAFGIPIVYRTEESTEERPEYFLEENGTIAQLENCAFEKVFSDSSLLIEYDFDTLRKRVRNNVEVV